MPYTYSISPSEKIVRVNLSGVFNNQLQTEGMNALAADPDFRPEYYVLIDARQMDYRPSASDLSSARFILHNMRHHFQGGVTVVVSPEFLPTAKLLCILSNAWGMQMEAVTNSDRLTSDRQE